MSTAEAVTKKSAIVIDFTNHQKILFSDQANEKRYPASLTKMMTVYILLNAIKAGKITMQTKFKVSRLAFKQSPSNLGLAVGEKISVGNIIKALLTKSANDMAVTAAEGLCGSIESFCKLMNKQAQKIGMNNTCFQNPSGLPNKKQFSTAADMAKLMISIYINFPEYWHLFSLKSFQYKSKTHGTHCKILLWYKGADGAKTGYIDASGFNLAITANKYNKFGNSKRLFAVVMGQNSGKSRDLYAASLMDKYFGNHKIGAQATSIKKSTHNSGTHSANCSFTNANIKNMKKRQYTEKQRKSLMQNINKIEKKRQEKNAMIVYDEEINIKDTLASSAVDNKYIDKLYENDEEIIQINEEEYIKKK